MRIATYCITFPEEYEVLENMLVPALMLGDLWLFDGGREYALCNTPDRSIPDDAIEQLAKHVNGSFHYRCYYVKVPWRGNPGAQRNAALNTLDEMGYDWIVQNDSDELWDNQSREDIPSYLTELHPAITNVQVKMLHLVDDEEHYWKKHHTYLVHGRIHRPGTVRYTETWHEHQNFTGTRVKSPFTLIHTKHLFVKRLKRISGGGLEQWHDMDKTPLPDDKFGLSWPTLKYPKIERRAAG